MTYYTDENDLDNSQIIINGIITAVTLGWMSFNIAESLGFNLDYLDYLDYLETPVLNSNVFVSTQMNRDEESNYIKSTDNVNDESVIKQYSVFHTIMVAAS